MDLLFVPCSASVTAFVSLPNPGLGSCLSGRCAQRLGKDLGGDCFPSGSVWGMSPETSHDVSDHYLPTGVSQVPLRTVCMG